MSENGSGQLKETPVIGDRIRLKDGLLLQYYITTWKRTLMQMHELTKN